MTWSAQSPEATSRLTVAQQQQYINAALAAGYSYADINSFIANNSPDDLPRWQSALAPNPGPSIAGPVNAPAQIATPTPLAGPVGSLTQPSASDGAITGTGPQLVYSGPGATALPVSVLPASGIPTWAIVAAVLVLFLLFKDRK